MFFQNVKDLLKWLDTLSFWQIGVEFTHADVLQLNIGMTVVGKGESEFGTKTSASSLLDLNWAGTNQ